MIVDGSVCFVKDGWEGRRGSATFFNCWSNTISKKLFLNLINVEELNCRVSKFYFSTVIGTPHQ